MSDTKLDRSSWAVGGGVVMGTGIAFFSADFGTRFRRVYSGRAGFWSDGDGTAFSQK